VLQDALSLSLACHQLFIDITEGALLFKVNTFYFEKSHGSNLEDYLLKLWPLNNYAIFSIHIQFDLTLRYIPRLRKYYHGGNWL